MKMLIPGSNILGDTFTLTLTRLSESTGKINKQGVVTEKGELIQEVVYIVSMMKERAKVGVIGQVHLGVDEICADEGRKRHPSGRLGPGRKIMKLGTHDRARDIALGRRNIDSKHTTLLDTVGDILKEMLASTIRGKTGKAIIEGLDHLRTEGDSLKVT